jgi:hypothetical protein
MASVKTTNSYTILGFDSRSWLDRKYGEVHKIPHYWFDAQGNKIDVAHLLKERWLKSESTSPVYHICGELSSIFTVGKTLERKRPMNLVIANELIKEDTRNTLADMLEMNENRELLNVYSAEKRPDMHGTLIDKNIFIEDWHGFGDEFGYAKAIENAAPFMIDTFLEYFNWCIIGKKPLTPAQIRAIPIKPISVA